MPRASDRRHEAEQPTFEQARNPRQKARAAGLHPDYWYAVEYDRVLRPGQVKEVSFWDRSIALYRDHGGRLHALEDRCAHRQPTLSLGEVVGCNLSCTYHGWAYDGDGRLTSIPHELFGRGIPSLRVGYYPVKVRYGLIRILPGSPAQAETRRIPDISELEGPNRSACVPLDFTWRAHHSMIVDNVSDFTQAYLHRKYRPFDQARLRKCEAEGDRIYVSYDAHVGVGRISGLFVDWGRVNTEHIELCYEYPYPWSSTDNKIKHRCFLLPIGQQTTRVFFLFYFDELKVPLVPLRIPRPAMLSVLKLANRLLIWPLLVQDGFAVQAEQQGYNRHFMAPIAELNPAVPLFQQLTIRKWSEYLGQAAPILGSETTSTEPRIALTVSEPLAVAHG
jgi:phenylpropionate dioxygenase-like ring-hydroxylating dioxygenase large terminal subunit